MGQEDSNPYPTNNYQQQQPGSYQSPPPNPYPPQQGYGQPYGIPQPSPYGYQDPAMHHNDAVIVGVAPVPIEHRPMVEESFGHQFKKLPHRMGRMFSKPSVATVEDLKVHATWGMTIFLLFVQIIWSIIIAVISYKIAMAEVDDANDNNPFGSDSSTEKKIAITIGASIGYAIASSIASFFIMNAIFHGVAMCLGGGHHNGQTSGNMFLQLCFFSVLFGVPLDFLSILAFIPWVGIVISIAILVARLVFFVLTLRGVYNISTGHAIGIIVCFIVICVVVVIVLAVVLAASIGTYLGYLIR